MENVYQALANSEKGLEATLLDIFKKYNLSIASSTLISEDEFCGGLKKPGLVGTCRRILYESTGTLWDINNRKIFKTDTYIFISESDFLTKAISDGIKEKVIRTIQIGPLPRY